MGVDNHGFIKESSDDSYKQVEADEKQHTKNGVTNGHTTDKASTEDAVSVTDDTDTGPKRENWGNELEFLMSCIAMSVGLGNVWRFPFVALENGGGAFLIPYLIVLLVVGRPIYYLEMIVGQFSSRGSVKVYDMVPALRGTGYGQLLAVFLLSTYYASLMATIGRYLVTSFFSTLPWAYCRPEWPNCIDSARAGGQEVTGTSGAGVANTTDLLEHVFSLNKDGPDQLITSSEHYFLKEVLKEKSQIDDGIGDPDWILTICLIVAWLAIWLTIIKGVKSAGKASYFLALFPYVIMIILLIRAVTLPGAGNGILYFITPQWETLLTPQVWYAAVTQCFFSLAVCFGNIVMYSSFNKFDHNIYRDVNVVTALDTCTSLIAGCTIFGILGHLAHVTGNEDVGSVVVGGAGLAFISYPDAIAKFDWLPQLFSVLFFFMLFVLGIGSNIAMTSCVMTIIRDQFPKVKAWQAASGVVSAGLLIGLVYITPGGQFILNLIDHFGTSFIAFVLAICELAAISWFYGVNKICKDTEFMIGRNPGIYWRICWGIITPLFMLLILIYTFATYSPLVYKNIPYPDGAYAAGWTIAAFGILQVPIWGIYSIMKQKDATIGAKIRSAFRPKANWGPSDPKTFKRYQEFLASETKVYANNSILHRFKRNVFG